MTTPHGEHDYDLDECLGWAVDEVTKEVLNELGASQATTSSDRHERVVAAVTPRQLAEESKNFIAEGSSSRIFWETLVEICETPTHSPQDTLLLRQCLRATAGASEAQARRNIGKIVQHSDTGSRWILLQQASASRSSSSSTSELGLARSLDRTLSACTAACCRLSEYFATSSHLSRRRLLVMFAGAVFISYATLSHCLSYVHRQVGVINANLHRGRNQSALEQIDALESSIRFHCSVIDYHNDLEVRRAGALVNLRRYDDAIKIIDQMLESGQLGHRDRSVMHAFKIAALTGLRDYATIADTYGKPRARRDLIEAPLTLYTMSLTNLGVSAAAQERYDAAANAFYVSSKIYSVSETTSLQSLTAFGYSAWIAVNRRDVLSFEQSIAECRRQYSVLPSGSEKNIRFARVLNNVGYGYLQRGSYAEAEKLFVEARSIELGTAPGADFLAECLASNERAAKESRKDGVLLLAAVIPNATGY